MAWTSSLESALYNTAASSLTVRCHFWCLSVSFLVALVLFAASVCYRMRYLAAELVRHVNGRATDRLQNLLSSLMKEGQETGQCQLFRGLSEADDFLILWGHQQNDLGITKVSLYFVYPNLTNLQDSDFKLDPSTHLCHWRPGNVRAMRLRPAHNLGFSSCSIFLPYSVLSPPDAFWSVHCSGGRDSGKSVQNLPTGLAESVF